MRVIAAWTGCGGGATTGESSSGGTEGEGAHGGDDDEEIFPGDVVECCWLVTYGAALPCNAASCYSYAEEACLPAGYATPCIDRQTADVDGDGAIDLEELQVACGQVCLDQDYNGTRLVVSSGLVPTDGAWDDPGGFVWNCSAIGTVNSSVIEGQTCTPPMDPDPPPFHVPTHLGLTRSGDSAGQLQLNILGTTLRPLFDGQTNLALFDCANGGLDGGTCTVQLEGLSLTLAEPVAVDEHTIPRAELLLAGVVETTVRFARCSQGTCAGHFQLGEPTVSPVGLGLTWVERHETTRSHATHYVPLSNGSAGFGGVSSLDGLITLDAAGQTGHLLLQGSGRDTFGDGAFASALFRIQLGLAPHTR